MKKWVLKTKGTCSWFSIAKYGHRIIISFMGLFLNTPQELWILWGLCGHIMNRIKKKKKIAEKLKWWASKNSEGKIGLCFHLNIDLSSENILWKVWSIDIFKMHVSYADLYAMCLIIYLKKAYFCFDREPIILVQGNRYHAIRLADDENHIFYQFNSREFTVLWTRGKKYHLVNFKSLVLIKILYNSKFI